MARGMTQALSMGRKGRGARPIQHGCWLLLALAGCAGSAEGGPENSVGVQSQSLLTAEAPFCPARPKWLPRGVGGGGALFAPAISPHHEREIFMASDMTGVYHSMDFGRSWTMLPFTAMEGNRHAFVRFTADANVIYALSIPEPPLGPLHIIKSQNAGRTWDAPVVTPGDPAKSNSLFADSTGSARVLYADLRRLFMSNDGGQTWATIYTTPWSQGLLVAGAHFAGNDIFVGTSDGMLVSHDGGLTFALEVNVGIPTDQSIVSMAAGRRGTTTRFFAVTFKNQDGDGERTITPDLAGDRFDLFAGVYRMTLGEGGWTRTAVDLPATQMLTMVAMALHDPDVAYLAGSDRRGDQDSSVSLSPSVFKTEDAGRSWRSVFLSQGNRNIATGWSGTHGDKDWYWGELAYGLAVAPHDSRRVVLTDMGFAHVTENGGRLWRQAYVLPRDENPAGHDTPTSKFYRSCGLEQTSCWWLTFSGPHTLFASFTDITSVFSRDGGESWTRDSRNGLADNSTYHVVTQPKTGILYGATASVHDIYQSPRLRDSVLDGGTGTVVTSSDRGAHWRVAYDFHHPVIWLALDPNRTNLLYASVVNSTVGGIYRLDLAHLDQPATLLPAPPRTKGHPFNVHVLHDGSLVASFSGHQDGNTRVFADRSGVFLLPPGATTWEERSAPEMHYWTKDLVIDPRNEDRWYVGVFSHDTRPFGGLYRSADRGLTWQKIANNYRVESCAIDPRNPSRMYMTTQGEGLWLSENLEETLPVFHQIREYPFQQPTRVFWNPFDPHEVWALSYGGGMRVARE